MSHASSALRTGSRPGQSSKFFAVCMVIVLAPRGRPLSRQASTWSRRASKSKPSNCAQNRLSSAAITASANAGAIRS